MSPHLTGATAGFIVQLVRPAGRPSPGSMNPLRKRELLLSLKYATVEACFSVPMLNLTLTQFPFAVGFAIKALNWSSSAIGLLAAIPFICNALQTPITFLLQRRMSLHRIMVWGFVVNALPWAFVWLLPMLGEHKHWVFGMIVFISAMANSVCAVAWSASMSELVPLHIRGRYFGARNLIYGFWTLLVVLAAGQIAERFSSSLAVFGAIFAAASLARLTGLFFLLRMKFPPQVMAFVPRKDTLADYLEVFRNRNYLWLLLFVGAWGFFLNLGSPFYSMYVLKVLPMKMGDLTILTTLASLGGIVSLKSWGGLTDRFGNKPVMLACAFLWATVALGCWISTGPGRYLHIYANYFIVGFMTAGFQLCQFALMIKLVPSGSQAHYISVFLAFTSLLTAAGPLVGGVLLRVLPERIGSLLGQEIQGYHVVFCLSLIGCLFATHLLQLVKESDERPMRELFKQMRGMREFNPLLGLASVAGLVVAPRALTRFANEKIRLLKRQTGDLYEVGEELAEGSVDLLKKTFDRDRPPSEPEKKPRGKAESGPDSRPLP